MVHIDAYSHYIVLYLNILCEQVRWPQNAPKHSNRKFTYWTAILGQMHERLLLRF